MSLPELIVLPLVDSRVSLELVGGKGLSLSKLVTAGLPVPPGFLISTSAYNAFVDANALQESIRHVVDSVASDSADSAETASASIHSRFETASIPSPLAAPILQAYAELDEVDAAVAVRSSATAEDLPDTSFAGQHDTFLNVRGETELFNAIRNCWASLWTARAISYRRRMQIDQRAVAMGVVVQQMVQADVAGILFTANPASGERSELVVNASFGLGEAVVGGHVTPDTFVLDKSTCAAKTTVVGGKERMIVPAGPTGTTAISVPADQRGKSSLSPEALRELGQLGAKVQHLFDGLPQDIEWAIAAGKSWLLQSRPITNLPPQPLSDIRWDPPAKGVKLIRRQVVENMPQPLSPLFEELYLQHGLEHSIDQWVAQVGLSFDIEELIERPMFLTVNGYAYCRASYRSTWRLLRVMPGILFWYAFSLRKLLRNLIPQWRDEGLPHYLGEIERWKKVDPETAPDETLLAGIRELTTADAVYWFCVAMVLGAAKITDDLLNGFLESKSGERTSGMFLRGFASKTMEAQEQLEDIAARIRASESLQHLVTTTPAADLLEVLSRETDGQWVWNEMVGYLQQYGHRVYNLDFVQPTQAEDPRPVLLSLQAMVQGSGSDTATRQAEMAREREWLETQTLKSFGPLNRWTFRTLLAWAQNVGPHREQALFYMGAAWPTLRRMALQLGRRLVESGALARPDDLFFLQTAEIEAACAARERGQAREDLAPLAAARRELREARKKLHPPGMVPEKSKFKIGPLDMSAFETQKRNREDSDTLEGFAVSPGKVTGEVSVILAPADFEQMKPRTILVCPTTTPAWTPLFAQATGLVTDIGGILAHGSIVAREYGIPAVMGTGNASRRLVSGQRITVDGDTGTVMIEPQHRGDPTGNS